MRSVSVFGFIPDLISLLLLFCLASSALPDEVGSRLDLEEYYHENRKRLWGLFALYTVWVSAVVGFRATMADAPLASIIGSIVPNLVLVSIMLVLAATSRRWVHTVGIALLLVTTGLAWLPQRLG